MGPWSFKLIAVFTCFCCISNLAIAQVKVDPKSSLRKYVDKYMSDFGKKGAAVPKADRAKAQKLTDAGWLGYKKMEYPGAFDNFFQAIRADRQYAPGYFGVAFLCSVKGELTDAILFYREALKFEKKFAPIYCNLANALLLQDASNPEIPILYKKAIEVNPKYTDAYLTFAGYLADRGAWAQAGELANMAIKQGAKIKPEFKEEFKKHGITLSE